MKDPLGFPVFRITAEYKENERKHRGVRQDKMEQWYRAAGAIAIQRAPGRRRDGRVDARLRRHAHGRQPARPTSSNRWGFSHEVPNLGVLGASVMGTSGAHNPTLTVQALAWRTAEHLVKNWKTHHVRFQISDFRFKI